MCSSMVFTSLMRHTRKRTEKLMRGTKRDLIGSLSHDFPIAILAFVLLIHTVSNKLYIETLFALQQNVRKINETDGRS